MCSAANLSMPAWAAGDLGRIDLLLKVVGDRLRQAVDVCWCDKVLEIAAADGGVWVADAENLPFEDGEFDVALSTLGVMFAPNPRRVAAELLRVVKPGGRIGLASWTPDGFPGELFRVMSRFVPSPAGAPSLAAWGTETGLIDMFGPYASGIRMARKKYVFHYLSAEHWIEVFRLYYGPMRGAFEVLDATGQKALHAALVRLLETFDRDGHDALIVPADYLEAVIRRA